MVLDFSFQAAMLSALLIGARASPFKRQTYAAAIETDFPDPSVIQGGDGLYYAYATAGNGVQCQLATSGDGVSWTLEEGFDCISAGSIAWAPEDPQVWAPDVTPGPDGIYWMYFSAIASSTGDAAKHCIGFATADNPKGPFTPTSDDPWGCDEDTGDIDPDQFLDEDGTRWVVWKVDGNSAGQDTPIMIQQVDGDDGNTKIGDATEILNRDDADGPLVEAPSLVKVDGTYYLTFSSNMYNTDLYDTSFATATSVTGPYTKAQAPDAPILTSDMQGFYGPGGADMFVSDVNSVIVWHGWDGPDLKQRYLYASSFNAEDDQIQIYFG